MEATVQGLQLLTKTNLPPKLAVPEGNEPFAAKPENTETRSDMKLRTPPVALAASMIIGVCMLVSTPLRALAQDRDNDRRSPDDRAVFTMSNDPSGNTVLVFDSAANGNLTFRGAVATGGLGTGGVQPDKGLANAGALALSENKRLLFVVNPGSDDISVLAVREKGVKLLDRESSGGQQPISVTVKGNLVYVAQRGW